VSNTATATENNPVYDVHVCHYAQMRASGGNMRTDKNEDTVCIPLPAMGHFFIFLLCHFQVHVENVFRPVNKGGLALFF
jgi:hypothetical protein